MLVILLSLSAARVFKIFMRSKKTIPQEISKAYDSIVQSGLKLPSRVLPHFCFGSEIWNWSEKFASLGSEKKAWFHMIHFDAKHQKSEAKTKEKKRKLSEKIEAKRKKTKKSEKSKKSEKKWKKAKRAKKIDLNIASLRFTSKQKWLNRSEAKNVKRKKRKKRKNAKK